jgi:preprotein translocase subunit SecE
LSDVRAEMRKVVSPSWIEVRTTTFVVIITVVLFGVFFFLVDWIFRVGVNNLLNKLGGSQ